jgi:hypothetical protein
MLKHVGKMKHNGAKVCVIYRTLPGDSFGALVVGTASLSELHHNSLMTEVESALGQQANEFGDHISNRFFQDGTNILENLHINGKLRRVATTDVVMTPTMSDEISLDQLNLMIAEQKGITLDDLSIKSDMPHLQRKTQVQEVPVRDLTNNHSRVPDKQAKYPEILNESPKNTVAPVATVILEPKTPSEMRSEADRLYKEAAKLKKLADEIEPPKKKNSAKKQEAS